MSSLPARIKKIQLKMKVLEHVESSQDFSYYKSMDFFRCSGAANYNSAVHGRNWSNFKLVQDFLIVLNTCENEEDLIKNEGARVFTT